MADISLYRKYRPHNFKNLVGQDHIRTTLMNAAKKDLLSHAYLFCGPRGTGKTSSARLVAKVLNCLNLKDLYEPCNECDICVSINEGRLIDIIEIDAASNRGIDEMRELKDKINFSPTNAKCKVYIIDEVHMLTKEAFNALLKTLEEPPAHAYFILATTESHKIPETIISRCQRFDFKRISDKTIMTRLSYIAQLEKVEADEGAIELIARYVDGGMRDAIGLFEQLTIEKKLSYENVRDVLGVTDHQSITRLFEHLTKKDIQSALNEIQSVHTQGHDMQQFVRSFLEYVREEMLASVSLKNPSQISWFVKVIEVFQDANRQLRLTVIPQLPLEIAIVKMCTEGTAIAEAPVAAKATPVVIPKNSPESLQPRKPKSDELRGLKSIPVEEDIEQINPIGEIEAIETAEDLTKELSTQAPANVNLETIMDKLPRIIEHIKQPASRRSFQTATLVALDGIVLSLEFSTAFHMEKVMAAEVLADIENAFKEILGVSLRLKGVLKKVNLKPAIEDVLPPRDHSSVPSKEDENDSASNVADMALDIFGGEIIED